MSETEGETNRTLTDEEISRHSLIIEKAEVNRENRDLREAVASLALDNVRKHRLIEKLKNENKACHEWKDKFRDQRNKAMNEIDRLKEEIKTFYETEEQPDEGDK